MSGDYVQGEAALSAKQEGRCAEAQSLRKKKEYAPRATVALLLRRAAAMARDEPPPRMVDDLEMQTARMLLSTGLTIYRKNSGRAF